MNANVEDAYQGWAVVELMGHRKVAGQVRQVEQYGTPMLRVDVFEGDAATATATQFYSGQSIYCLTPVHEDVARGYAKGRVELPVERWELPAAPPPPSDIEDAQYDDCSGDDCAEGCDWRLDDEEEPLF